jgi:hypothetical protein
VANPAPPQVSPAKTPSSPPSSDARRIELRSATIKYGSLISLLSIISFFLIPNFADFMSPFNLLIVPTDLLLVTMYVGRIFSILNYRLFGDFLYNVLFAVVFLYFFLSGVDSLVGTQVSELFAATFAGLEPSILIFFTSFFVYSFGSRLVGDGAHFATGFCIRKISGSLLLLSLSDCWFQNGHRRLGFNIRSPIRPLFSLRFLLLPSSLCPRLAPTGTPAFTSSNPRIDGRPWRGSSASQFPYLLSQSHLLGIITSSSGS